MKEKRNRLFIYTKISILIILFHVSNIANAAWVCVSFANGGHACGWVAECSLGMNGMDMGGNYWTCIGIIDNSGEVISNYRLLVNSESNAVLDIDGKVVNILSDQMERFLRDFQSNKEVLDVDKYKKQIDQLRKLDKGVVSQERLENIASKLNVKIIKVGKLPEVSFSPQGEDKNGALIHKSFSNKKTIAIVAITLLLLVAITVFIIKKAKRKKRII